MSISTPSLTYVSIADAKSLNSKLQSIEDAELTRLLYTAEEIIDAYVSVYTPEEQIRSFPRAEDTGVPYNIQLACALLASYVRDQDRFWDPTMGGIIAWEKGLERSISYNKKEKNFLADVSLNIPHTIKALLERFKGNASDLTGFDMLHSNTPDDEITVV